MKRALIVALAFALGAPVAAAETPQFSWTGFYVGGRAGGAWSSTVVDATEIAGDGAGTGGFPATGIGQGVFTGAHVGYLTQRGGFVFGIELGASRSSNDAQIECGNGSSYGYICAVGLDGVATLTGRVGLARGHQLLYVSAGAALGLHSYDIREPYAGVPSWGAAREMATGLTVGVGVERYLSHGISVRTDFTYVRFPTRGVTLTSPTYPATVLTATQNYVLASVSFNYRFGLRDYPPAGAVGDRDWTAEFGRRAWINFGSYQFDLFNPFSPSDQLSRLVYAGYTGIAGEAYLRSQSPGGFFFRVLAGTGPSRGGTLVDEDYPPATNPYSRTVSELRNGRLVYRSYDIGYQFYDGPAATIDGFVGGVTIVERYQAYGCTQRATHPTICDPSVPEEYEAITQTSSWSGLRVGLAGEIEFAGRWSVRGEASILPLLFLRGLDNHWLRPDINPLPVNSRGFGYQLEGAIAYAVGERLSLGAGMRFWSLRANGVAEFPSITEPQTTISRHYGAFAELTYQLGR